MKIFGLDSNLDIDETRKKIEQNRLQLETLINSEDSSSVVMQEFEKQVDRINQILFELHAEDSIDPDVVLQKSKKLKRIGSLLLEAASKYQESFSEDFFQQVKHLGLWFQGTAKQYEIHAFSKRVLKPSKQDVIKSIELNTDFVENYWETHPEEILEKEKIALQLVEDDKLGILINMPNNLREVTQKFIDTALSAAEKARLKEIKSSSKSVQQILDWAINSPSWQGDDLESCLEIVKNSRIQTEF